LVLLGAFMVVGMDCVITAGGHPDIDITEV
jgi:hypothetical protein